MSVNPIILQTKRRQRVAAQVDVWFSARADLCQQQADRVADLLASDHKTRVNYFALCEAGLKDVFPPAVRELLKEALL